MCAFCDIRKTRKPDGRWTCSKCGEPVEEPPDRFAEIAESGQAPVFGFAREGRMEKKLKLVTEAEAWEREGQADKNFQDVMTKATTQRGHRLKDAYYEKQVKPPLGQDIQPSKAPA